MTNSIDITGIDKAAVLAALYNATRPMGMGALRFIDREMTLDEARDIIENGSSADYAGPPQKGYFDYLHGRCLKIDLTGDTLRTGLYDRDNGEGAALRALTKAGLLTRETSKA